MKNWFRISLMILVMTPEVYGQNEISGYVMDEDSVPYTKMEIKVFGIEAVTKTNESGYFKFHNIPDGEYAFSFDYGYDVLYKKVIVNSQPLTLNIVIQRRIEFDEVLIKATKWQSDNQSNVQNFKLSEQGIYNPTQDLPYILNNAVSLLSQSDAGTGIGYTSMRIRGIDPSHVQVTMNGIPFNDAESAQSYFVDIPDIINSTEEICISRGYVGGRSGNGSFGAAIDLNLNKLHLEPFVKLASSIGSFNLLQNTIVLNSGLIENKYNVEGRISYLHSDGFISRSNAKLHSYFLSFSRIKQRSSLRFNWLYGRELTGQAWNGVPESYLRIDSLYRFNFAGTEKTVVPYNNEIDSYKQNHLQAFYQKKIKNDLMVNHIFNFTLGNGFYENYKANQELLLYNISLNGRTYADIIRRKYLGNQFVFYNVFFEKKLRHNVLVLAGFSSSFYWGKHFGIVPEIIADTSYYNDEKYYDNIGRKIEFSPYLKSEYNLNTSIKAAFDFHCRYVDYSINGSDDIFGILNLRNRHFLWSPKVYLVKKFGSNISANYMTAYTEREPYREDVLRNHHAAKEKLLNIEVGAVLNKKNHATSLNFYFMNYWDQLVLNGAVNDVGEAIKTNVPHSYRAGIELQNQSTLFECFSISSSFNFSKNIIPKFTESIPIYDSFYHVSSIDVKTFENRTISNSPGAIISFQLNYSVINCPKNKWNLGLMTKYVHSFFLDNNNNLNSKLNAYQILNFKTDYTRDFNKHIKLNMWFSLQNLLGEKYTTHGWFYQYKTDYQSLHINDPYHKTDDGYLHYAKAIYPQALRNWSFGLNITFS